RRHFVFAHIFQLARDLGDHLLDALGIDRALAQRYLDRAHQLVAVERHAAAVTLDHGQLAQLDPFEGGKAEIARETHAAPANNGRVFRRPRILHLGVEASATRATHRSPLARY